MNRGTKGRRTQACLCCGKVFAVDPRSRGQQKYCSEARCRKASKAASQRRWLAKPENEGYFSGPEHLERLRAWRAAHPGYWREPEKKPAAGLPEPIQDLIDKQVIEALRKFPPSDLPIQELMAHFSRRLLQLEQEQHQPRRGTHGDQTSAAP